jgi:cytoskeletal protein CcmA (bactofilin family)
MLFRKRNDPTAGTPPPVAGATTSEPAGAAPQDGVRAAVTPVRAPRVPGLGVTIISPRTRIHGRLEGEGSILVQGRVEGSIAVGGGVTVADTGSLDAEVVAPVIEVAGEARGSIVASIRVSVEATGMVEGTLATPILDLQPGSILRGRARIAGVPGRERRGLSH